MAIKFEKNDVDQAVAKLPLPAVILKEVEKHRKIFDSAVSTYRFNSVFNRTIGEDPEAKKERLDALRSELEPILTSIFTPFYAYQGKANHKKLETIVNDVKKKYKATFKEEFPKPESIQPAEGVSVPEDVISECRNQKKLFDAAMKEKGSASFSSLKFRKKGRPFDALKKSATSSIGCIYAANMYYNGTVGFGKLSKIADSVDETVRSIRKKEKEALFDDETIGTYYNSVHITTDAPASTDGKMMTMYFLKDTAPSYKDAYEKFLRIALDFYTRTYQYVREQKAQAKNEANKTLNAHDNTLFEEKAKEANKLLKEFETLKTEAEKFIEKHPEYKIKLSGAIKKLHNSKFTTTIQIYKEQLQEIRLKGKYGGDPGSRFENMDFFLNSCAKAIKEFIDVFSDPKSSLKSYFKAASQVNKKLVDLKKITDFKQMGDYKIDNATIDEYVKQLNDFSQKVSKEIRKWDKKYGEYTALVADYEDKNSKINKFIQIAKIAGLIIALAGGAAQITASLSSEGLKVDTAKKG